MIDLMANPFYLDSEDALWVNKTLASMSLEEKVGQVFCPMGFNSDEAFLNHLIREKHVGAMMYRPDGAANIQKAYQMIQDMAEIPLLLAANTECGGDGLAFEGTSFGKPMAVAATGNSEHAYQMGYTACREGAAVGLNWSFAPIVDLDLEFHNPITNVRTFGSSVETVIECASAYMRGADENQVAVAIKHFPGDGTDERDQHILTSVNQLSCEDWDKTYGRIYQTLIAQGAKTVMVGHIAQPEYVKRLNPEATIREQYLPGSLSKELLTGLLRGKLGFNGLISTDATPMVGFTAAMPRKDAIPRAIAAGCDMILFNKSLDEDYGFLMDGIQAGIVTEERLDEAVTRILAVKASLKLHKKKENGTLVPKEDPLTVIGCEQFREWAREVADESITLVKDTSHLLPLSPKKYRRVYLNVIQKDLDPDNPMAQAWKALFEKEGFEVTLRDRTVSVTPRELEDPASATQAQRNLIHEMYRGIGEMKENYDLYVYVCNMENASNNTTLRLNWNVAFGLGDDAPWHASEIPMLMISTACPYHLFDAPMIPAYINAYSADPAFREAVMDKIMGRSEFKGKSPVDPFCGKGYIRSYGEMNP